MRQASQAGGGWVYVPPGDYLTGTLEMLDNVCLYLEAGATVRGSKDRRDDRHDCLLCARKASNFSLRGRGVFDGSGTSFWEWDAEAARLDKSHLKGRWVTGK